MYCEKNYIKRDGQMKITDKARDVLKQLLLEHNTKNIRVYFAGFG